MKYRVWDKIRKKMYYPWEGKYSIDLFWYLYDEDNPNWDSVDYRTVLMQSTWILDSKWKLIYQGDIIEAIDMADGCASTDMPYIKKIIYMDNATLETQKYELGSFCWINAKWYSSSLHKLIIRSEWKIIWNIYETENIEFEYFLKKDLELLKYKEW